MSQKQAAKTVTAQISILMNATTILTLVVKHAGVMLPGEMVSYSSVYIIGFTLHPLTAKLFNLNFHPLEVVSR